LLEFPDYTAETAPAGARAALQKAGQQFGFVPSPLARMAAAPATIDAFERLNAMWTRASLTPIERETVVLSLAVHNGCAYCVAMHSAVLARTPEHAALVEHLRRGEAPTDARLAALSRFTRSALVHAGEVDDAARAAFIAAGYSSEQALEIMLGIATYTLSTFINRLTAAPLDAAFSAFEWEGISART
jgi:uncharacterized peroxidase-related enzyme